ncbi:DUF3667 domain-containing protein [Tellurirhabdus rosea]|uniref:DUF3667 domain-containing protein n=1 Tax=Tellurirhabdus rosea TaxID=2674997 RepID=UPI0022557324|nr:DUF3667 domain-containing protein [Tellurirhabdus rosea]
MSSHHKKLSVCPNCNTALNPEDNFCPTCGQENHDLKLPLSHLLYEFVESITHFDNKLWNTLKAVFTRPGRMTSEFLEGKRARYVPPARLYVFVSVIFFFLITKFADYRLEKSTENGLLAIKGSESIRGLLEQDSLLKVRGLESIASIPLEYSVGANGSTYLGQYRTMQNGQLDSLLRKGKVTITDQNRERLRQALRLLPDTVRPERGIELIPVDGRETANIAFASEEEQNRFDQTIRRASNAEVDSVVRAAGGEVNFLNRIAVRNGGRLTGFMNGKSETLREITNLFLKKLSVIMFVLMPFVAFLLYLFYARRKQYRRYYFDHLIFSVHAHSVIFLFFSLALGVTYFMNESTTDQVLNWTLWLCWLYFLLSLKEVYKQGWVRTTVKFLLLSVMYSVTVFCFFLLALALGITTT